MSIFENFEKKLQAAITVAAGDNCGFIFLL